MDKAAFSTFSRAQPGLNQFGNTSFSTERPLIFFVPQRSWNSHQQKAQRSVTIVELQAAELRS